MNVCHVVTSLDAGGAEQVLYRLCLNTHGVRHTVVSLRDRGVYGAPLEAAGVQVHTLGLKPGRLTWAAVRSLYGLLNRSRPDVVQTWMYHSDLLGGLVARAAGIRSVVWAIHNSRLVPGKSADLTIRIARLNAFLSRHVPAAIIACGIAARDSHIEDGYMPGKFHVVPNGYDLDIFKPDPDARERVRSELGLEAGIPVIGCVARFDPMKDHATLLAAAGLLVARGIRFQLLLVGAGMDGHNPELATMIRNAGAEAHVRLLGPRTDIPAVMNALDLHVLSSMREAFPNVLAEAMACGVPCVTTDVGDAAHIVGPHGRVVPPGDPAALAEALALALVRPADSDACRRHIAENYSIGRMCHGYLSVWKHIHESS